MNQFVKLKRRFQQECCRDIELLSTSDTVAAILVRFFRLVYFVHVVAEVSRC